MIGRLTAAGIFVDSMEKWTAAGDEPTELSMARVKDCHLCLLRVGFRLGHVPTGEKRSITHLAFCPGRVARARRVAGFNLPRPVG